MTRILLLLALSSATVFGAEPTTEQVYVRASTEAVPVCETAHPGVLAKGIVTLKPGETVCLSLRVIGNSVVPTASTQSHDPKNTLVLKAWYEAGATFLVVYNPLPEFLGYQAALQQSVGAQSQHTSVCSVLPLRRGIERWPYPIAALSLSEFKLLPDSKSVICQ